MNFSVSHKILMGLLALLTASFIVGFLAGCDSTTSDKDFYVSHKNVGPVEMLYQKLGGPPFVGDYSVSHTIVVDEWFERHYDHVAKFNGKSGICNGHEENGRLAPRENIVCAGAAHAWLIKNWH
jgi:hypothetical protein